MNYDFNILENKINIFKRKYLLYQFLRGILIVLLLSIVFYLMLNSIEYYLFMPSVFRRISFLTMVVFLSLISIRYILFPLVQLSGIINILNRRKISGLIQMFIPEIKDKLLNIIELNELKDKIYSDELTNAAISQKINELKIIDFSKAISFKNLKNLILYLLISFFVVMTIYMVDKSMIIDSGNRIIHFNQEFVRPAPFSFELMNSDLKVKKGLDYTVKVKCKGKDLPSVLYINIGGNNFVMTRKYNDSFLFDINSVTNNIEFYFTDLKFNSINYVLNVIPVAVINSFKIMVFPPEYTGLPDQTYDNIGDITIPAGSRVKWLFDCYDTDSLQIVLKNGGILEAEKKTRGKFEAEKNFNLPVYYDIQVKNNENAFQKAMGYSVNITEDIYPEIKIERVQDSVVFTRLFFKGNIYDDYGFSKLEFHINTGDEDSAIALPFLPYLKPQDFYYSVDLKDYGIPGTNISYYFSVSDNDIIKGPKTTTSDSYVFQFPDRKQLEEKNDEQFREIEKLMKQGQEMAKEIKSDLKDLQLKNLEKNNSAWQKSERINEIMSKKENLENILNQVEKLNQNSNNFNNTFNKKNEEVLQKQEEIQQLLNAVMTDELKKLLEEFSKLAQEFNEKQLNELSKKMNISMDDLEKQLNRNLETLKKMKIEQDFRDIIERVKSIQQNEEHAAGEIKGSRDFEEIKNTVNQDIDHIENTQQKLSEIVAKNDLLEQPLILDEFKEEFGEIKKNMEQSVNELDKKNRKKSSESINETSEKLKNLIFSMEQIIKSNNQEQNEENIRNLEQILKNLVHLSFNQEDILQRLRSTGQGDPEIREVSRRQKEIIDESKIIKDSLYALAKRSPMVGNVVNNELLAMELNMERSKELMTEGMLQQATVNQQLVITSVNNLALFLSDVLKQIEQMQENSKNGNGNCKKPGKGKPGMGDTQKMGENLQKQLQQMIEQMKNGGKSMSRQMGESMMMHEMMQQMLRDMMNSGGMGNDMRKQLQEIDDLLEQNKREIVNKNINPSLIRRHNEIISRLLEAEKSENERDLDNKRESNTADEKFYSRPADMFEFNRKENITIENIINGSLKLNTFYLDKYKNYVEKINDTTKE